MIKDITVEEWLGEDNQLGIDIWNKKYRQNDETFSEWLQRVSGGYEDMAQLIYDKKFLFGGRILSNRGPTSEKSSLSNCYVMAPVEDSIEDIYETRKKLARTYSAGGGCGIDISNMAPAGAKVRNQAKQTSGAVSFMDGFSLTTEEIGQNGRRGALMISINCTHPDLLEFIKIKTDTNKVTKANISVKVTNDFMESVEADLPWELSFTREETGETISKMVQARDVFHILCENNWDYAEPGILYWDIIENWNFLSEDPNFKYAGVNPCAEEPLPAGGSCLLGSLNLSEFIVDGKFDFDELKRAAYIATKGLNDVLDEGLPRHPLEEQRESVRNWRQIGLGVFGVADMLIKMKLTYGGEESLILCKSIARTILNAATKQSALLAKEKGTYPQYSEQVLKSPFYIKNIDEDVKLLVEEYGLHNSQLLTIPPTGTLSTMLGVSGAAEPIFANYYTRKTESLHGEDVYYKVYTPIVDRYIKEHNLKDDTELPEYFVTSSTIDIENRIKMQAAWQQYIDASISSTINLPHEATIDDVKKIYLEAWKTGLKGVTVFRDGCKRVAILSTDKPKEEPKIESIYEDYSIHNNYQRGEIIGVADDLLSTKRTIVNGCGKFYLHMDFDQKTGEPLETYINLGSGGGCERNLEFISRLISVALRAGVPIEEIISQAKSIRPCLAYIKRTEKKGDTSKGTSCPSAIGIALEDLQNTMDYYHVYNELLSSTDCESSAKKGDNCPECGQKLRAEGGCQVCAECGWSRCE